RGCGARASRAEATAAPGVRAAYRTTIARGARPPGGLACAAGAVASAPVSAAAQHARRVGRRLARAPRTGRGLRSLIFRLSNDDVPGPAREHCRRGRGETDERALLPTG